MTEETKQTNNNETVPPDFSGIVKLRDGTIAVSIKDTATDNWIVYPIWDRAHYIDNAGFCTNRKKDIVQCYKGSVKQPVIPQKVV